MRSTKTEFLSCPDQLRYYKKYHKLVDLWFRSPRQRCWHTQCLIGACFFVHRYSPSPCVFTYWKGLGNSLGFPGGSDDRVCLQCRRPRFDPWVRKISWRKEWLPTPVFLPGESHGQRNLAGYTPWSCTESDTTFTFIGNPLWPFYKAQIPLIRALPICPVISQRP